jgi:hypothetical protein
LEQIDIRKKMLLCNGESSCIPQETIIKDVRLAAAYVPYEKFCTLFSPLEALKKGTAFPALYSPFEKEKKSERPCNSVTGGRIYER